MNDGPIGGLVAGLLDQWRALDADRQGLVGGTVIALLIGGFDVTVP